MGVFWQAGRKEEGARMVSSESVWEVYILSIREVRHFLKSCVRK